MARQHLTATSRMSNMRFIYKSIQATLATEAAQQSATVPQKKQKKKKKKMYEKKLTQSWPVNAVIFLHATRQRRRLRGQRRGWI